MNKRVKLPVLFFFFLSIYYMPGVSEKCKILIMNKNSNLKKQCYKTYYKERQGVLLPSSPILNCSSFFSEASNFLFFGNYHYILKLHAYITLSFSTYYLLTCYGKRDLVLLQFLYPQILIPSPMLPKEVNRHFYQINIYLY